MVAPNFFGVYLYPLNQDGSTYGDGRFGSSATGPPPSSYWWGNIVTYAGTAAPIGLVSGVLKPGDFKFVGFNQLGAALAGSGANTAKYRTYDRSVA